ncbi:hypothetical protein [Frankia sp. Cppng1_Ct_nod]|uniref:hypothetical protein n=1 Tax=Frankia sp. Cppng1_Ct_nod TaxID=2897162 RepID=UPI0013EFBBA9|nr:hypothetical protein [Frankia sp. Cppng1_Ct_nod]
MTVARDSTADGDRHERMPVLWGVVRFEPGDGRRVRDTTITFDSAGSAELFALEQGWGDYQITPLFFFVENVVPPAGSRMVLDAALTRTIRRAGGR